MYNNNYGNPYDSNFGNPMVGIMRPGPVPPPVINNVGIMSPGPVPPPIINNAFSGASAGIIQAYGEKWIDSGNAFVHKEMDRYFSNPQYYFHVNDQYVKNKLRIIFFPFLHKSWVRISEPVSVGRISSYKPPIFDINAPDLYIPFMAFGTFVILAGLTLGFMGKFNPEALNVQFTRAFLGWVVQTTLLKGLLYSSGRGEVPLLDLASYGGYLFVGLSLAIAARLLSGMSYYFVLLWTSFCMAVFVTKTMRRVFYVETRNSDRFGSRQHYIILFMAIAQFPLAFWLGRIRA